MTPSPVSFRSRPRPSASRWGRLCALTLAAACAPAAGGAGAGPLVAGDTVEVRGTARFRRVVLDDRVTRAHALDVAADGRVFFLEREGAIKVWDPRERETRMVGFLPVHAVHTSGLLGIALDPDFTRNGWVYLYYSPYTSTENLLARFTIRDDRLVPESRRVLLEVPLQRDVAGGHSAGALAFGPDGTLYLGTGDNTSPAGTPYAPIDERPGREIFDAQRSAGNSWDLRGKILRIRPLPDGGYEIPAGNLFPHGTLGRPEIYVMGTRQPYRISVDPRTGWLYWGDVGPDAPAADSTRGPAGHDEFNQAREPGNFGWPYFLADNRPYHDFDFDAGKPGAPFRADVPLNESRNNTGSRVLPPARPAMIWYPYAASPEFPMLGAGGRAAMVGPLYRYDRARTGRTGLPAAFDGSLFIFDWMRNWIQEARFTPAGDLDRVQPFLPEMQFVRPTAMDVGPDGTLYLIEWGENYEGWYNDSARLVRLEYVGTDPSPPPPAPARPAPALSFAWPVEGGVFDFGAPIPYRVTGARAAEARVTPLLGHDSHTHELTPRTGAERTVRIDRDETHLYLEDHFALLEAVPGAGNARPARVALQPRVEQAEHAHALHGATRETRGNLRRRLDVQGFLRATDGSHAAYGPVNLVGIHAVTFRVSPAAGGTIELRSGAPDGALLGQLRVEGAAAGAQDAWIEATAPVRDPGGAHPLFLVFRGPAEQPLLRVDWFRFDGPGVMQGPR